ncbi:hypothetical protein AVEN_32838-1 [Araneus ventricosus]|uniref:Endonuclease/exonuclease/phosphatase domain-containing protein n=1 Tax=Araneus ventricosus TaxID=182803 RepID=A0A4Y2E1U9_ARAVE|nr:hypothetical protein AVEN_32838-1 [Araneus ventricosus]
MRGLRISKRGIATLAGTKMIGVCPLPVIACASYGTLTSLAATFFEEGSKTWSTETRLRPSKNLYVANFRCYKTDRDNQNIHKPGGGTAILIKNHLPHHHIPTPQLFYIESTIINLTLPNKDPIVIIFTYIPPSPVPNFFTLGIENLMQVGPYCIFGGDFKAHNKAWGSISTTTRGKQLKQFANSAGLDIIASQPIIVPQPESE